MGAERLAANLREASTALVATIARTRPEQWLRVPAPGTWSIGKEVEHVIEAAGYHQWIVRRTIGDKVSPRRRILERQQLTTELSLPEAIAHLQARTEEGVTLLLGLTDEQLELPTRPPRARSERLAQTIAAVLIGHYGVHGRDIEAKQQAFGVTGDRK